MKHFIYGFCLAALLSAAPSLANHYFGHSTLQEDMNRNAQQQERNEQRWERFQQDQFRNQQRMNPC